MSVLLLSNALVLGHEEHGPAERVADGVRPRVHEVRQHRALVQEALLAAEAGSGLAGVLAALPQVDVGEVTEAVVLSTEEGFTCTHGQGGWVLMSEKVTPLLTGGIRFP